MRFSFPIIPFVGILWLKHDSGAPICQRFAAQMRAAALAVGASVLLFGQTARADTYAYTGPTGGSATTPVSGNFTGDFVDTSTGTTATTPAGGATDILSFGGTAAYTATDDITSVQIIGGLTFTNSAAITTATANTLKAGQNLAVAANNSGSVGFAQNINLNGFGATFSGTGAGATTFTGVISGDGGLIDNKTGGSVTLGTSGNGIASTYMGTTQINSGSTLVVGYGTSLGSTSGGLTGGNQTVVASGGEAALGISSGGTIAEPFSIAGTGASAGAGVLHANVAGTVTLSGAIGLTGDSLVNNTTAGVIAFTGSVDLAGHTLTDAQHVSITDSAPITSTGGGGNLTVGLATNTTLAGITLTLTGNNTYTGTTTIGTVNTGGVPSQSGGILRAFGTVASGNKALGGTTLIAVNNGTLSLASSNQASSAANITLGLAAVTTGTAESATVGLLTVAASTTQGTAAAASGGVVTGTTAQGLGSLTLNNTATLTFGGAATTVVFGTFTPNGNVLTIVGYGNAASAGSSGSSSDDRLVFQGDQTLNLGDFNFGTGAGVGVREVALDGGFYEVIGTVPEPATWAGGVLLLLLAAGSLTTANRRSRLCGIHRA